jgi:hypothetical protein
LKVTLKFKYFRRVGKVKIPLKGAERNGLPTKLIIECENDLHINEQANFALRGYVISHGLVIPTDILKIFTPIPEDPSRSL